MTEVSNQAAETVAAGDEPIASAVDGAQIRQCAQHAMATHPFYQRIGENPHARDALLEAIETIPMPEPLAGPLAHARATRPPLFDHSVSTALLAACLMRESGNFGRDVMLAAAAGLYHDLGMLQIDPALLEPGKPLVGESRKLLYAHPLIGAKRIAQCRELPDVVARAVLEHHERLDGSGYPRSVSGDAISPMGRVLSVAEVVTAMLAQDRPFPYQRVSLALRMNPGRYDESLVRPVHRLLRDLVSDEDVDATGDRVEAALNARADLLARGREMIAAHVGHPDPKARVLLSALAGQIATIERMLTDAGVRASGLDDFATLDTPDPTLRVEWWALSEELRWQLRLLGLQVQRRWQAAAAGELPVDLAAWIDAVIQT